MTTTEIEHDPQDQFCMCEKCVEPHWRAGARPNQSKEEKSENDEAT